ncbi:uncharacterized protein NEMAJ01_1398 [Nematocida major]|uniref:uncharacterized protein n=1 Tax=Nematocida major TaxID=1912982 RepID=UPI00200789EA|nr:uncharacterized protein NEMAJ01_1398 [Nematocida major]KAH9386502.1 hypothetical protein NEMAJ01_1398 [Nematocida major]
MDRSINQQFIGQRRMLWTVASVALLVLVEGARAAADNFGKGGANPIESAPNGLLETIWFSLAKFTAVFNASMGYLLSFKAINNAMKGGILNIGICAMQAIFSLLFLFNYQKKSEELYKPSELEINALSEKVAEEQQPVRARTKNTLLQKYLDTPLFEEVRDSQESKPKHEKTKRSYLDTAQGYVISAFKIFSIWAIIFVYIVSLFKAASFVGMLGFVGFDRLIMAGELSKFFLEKIPGVAGLLHVFQSINTFAVSPQGTIMNGCLMFFGRALAEYCYILSKEDEKEKVASLYKKNGSIVANIVIRGIFLYLIVTYNITILLMFMEPIVEFLLSKQVGDWIIELLVAGIETPDMIRRDVGKNASFKREWKICLFVRMLGAMVAFSYMLYATNLILLANPGIVGDIKSAVSRMRAFIPA